MQVSFVRSLAYNILRSHVIICQPPSLGKQFWDECSPNFQMVQLHLGDLLEPFVEVQIFHSGDCLCYLLPETSMSLTCKYTTGSK